MTDDNRWKWQVTLRYNDTVIGHGHKHPGDIAIRTRHVSDSSKDAEVAAAQDRTDVTIDVVRLNP